MVSSLIMSKKLNKVVCIDRETHSLLRHLSLEEGRTMYGMVRTALELYDEWRQKTENAVHFLDGKKRKK